MKFTLKKLAAWAAATATAIAAITIVCNVAVTTNSRGRTYDDPQQTPYREVGLVLGTPPLSVHSGRWNPYFHRRLEAAARLYKAGKVSRLLLSGSDQSAFDLNEVTCMRDSLRLMGVPDSVMTLDGKGYRTLTSIRRASEVYRLGTYTIISQKWHCERAIYQADHSGVDVRGIVAFSAADVHGLLSLRTDVREWLARVKLMIDIYLPHGFTPMANATSAQ